LTAITGYYLVYAHWVNIDYKCSFKSEFLFKAEKHIIIGISFNSSETTLLIHIELHASHEPFSCGWHVTFVLCCLEHNLMRDII
jgi:hypothetical protein